MAVYHLTTGISLTVKRTPPSLRCFIGRTNRLALYSLTLLCWEMNFYVARNWDAQAWDDSVSNTEFISEFPAPVVAPARARILPFRAVPAQPVLSLPPRHNKR